MTRRPLLFAAAAAALALAASLAGPASAASYTVTTTAAQEAAITDARAKFNAALPQVCDAQGQNCTTPGQVATNGAYMLQVVTQAIANWTAASATRATLLPTDKAAAIALLQADVARGDANSASAASLLALVQAAQ